MAYEVVEVDDYPESPPDFLLESTHFPPEEEAVVVTTGITFWEVEHNVGGFLTWSYWKSIFNMKKDYNILVQQKDSITSDTQTFLLYSSDNEEMSREAYKVICSTLTPLVDDCTLLLSEELLEGIILPVPIKPSKLMEKISDLMELNPEGHSDWVKVLQSLVLVAVGNDDEDSDQSVEKVLNKTGKSMNLGVTDRVGNTALHLAKSAKSVQHVIKASEKLSVDERKKLLNQKNKKGKAPLHSAFQENKHNVVRQLIAAGADLTATTGDEEGSNPLHMAAEAGSAESVRVLHQGKECFLQRDSKNDSEKEMFQNALNAPNKHGHTPLMLSVRKNFINSVVTFLQAGANPDIQNPKNGNTALHYAAEMGYTPILKALLAFGAKFDIKNKAGKTPLETASDSKADGAKECMEVLKEMIQLTKEADEKVCKKFEHINIPPNSIFLLSMDGGGTRGLLLTQTLFAIQKRMKQLKPDCRPIQEYFDYIAGTSAGGLVTLSIGSVGATLAATRASLFKAGDEICKLSATFPSAVVARSSKETYGNDTLMTDVKHPRVITTTALADRNPPILHLMCNYGGARNGQKPPSEWKVWEAGRCTSAAPVYFPPYENKFVDGGIMANNPTLDAMADIVVQEEKEKSGRKLAMIVSLGTGIFPPAPKTDDVAIYVPNLRNFFKAISNIGDTMSAAFNFLHLIISQASVSNGQEVIRAEAWCKSLGIPYYRLSPHLNQIVDLTENDVALLTNMMLEGQTYLLRNADQVDAIVCALLSRDQ